MDPAILLALILQYRYFLLPPAALAWGFLVCMLVGVAIRLGYLEFWFAYPLLMLGELVGDVIWYWVGYLWGERFARHYGQYVGITFSAINTAKHLFHRYNQRILFVSKLTSGGGFSIPILFTAGLSRVSFVRYMSANILGQFFWTGGLIAIGYYFGDLYLQVNSVFEKIVATVVFIILMFALVGFVRYARAKLI